jgi:hypothetical protein
MSSAGGNAMSSNVHAHRARGCDGRPGCDASRASGWGVGLGCNVDVVDLARRLWNRRAIFSETR